MRLPTRPHGEEARHSRRSLRTLGCHSRRSLRTLGYDVRAVSNHGSKSGLVAILRDALASLGLLRMRPSRRPRHSASISACTRVFDALWTRVNALKARAPQDEADDRQRLPF